MNPQGLRMLYVSGLPACITVAELVEICRPFGEVVSATLERDPETGAPWPFGFVEFEIEEAAVRAAASLHGKKYRGDILAARPVRPAEITDGTRDRG